MIQKYEIYLFVVSWMHKLIEMLHMYEESYEQIIQRNEF